MSPTPGLHIVATPIGNLADITHRALDVLRGCDVIACEDTRVTGVLLRHYGIATPTTPYHEHNAAKVRPVLIARMAEGARVALVSDAGTPLISDPGYRLVESAHDAGIAVTSAPGPSAVMAALCVAGLPTDVFTFAGFLPAKPAARRAALARLAAAPGSLVLFESGRRLPAALADLQALGPRPAAVCRELTKLYEEVRRGDLVALAAHYAQAGPPRGEVVLVIGPAPATEAAGDAEIDAALRPALAAMSLRDAADAVAEALGAPRRRVYGRALVLAGEAGAD
ncbi:MAG: 16S rRNA (cytidine(1402)-2'-O)-methyltransferase [Alphaproteobacteria bacterium]